MVATLKQQIEEAFPTVVEDTCFGPNCWLTFYIGGQPGNVQKVADALADMGGKNLEGATGGMIYAKLPIATDLAEAVDCAQRVETLCVSSGAFIVLIDADTTANVEQSTFKEIYQSP